MASDGYPEAQFFICQQSGSEDDIKEPIIPVSEIFRYYENCCQKGMLKAYACLGNVYFIQGQHQRALELYQQGADMGCFKCIYEMASHQLAGTYCPRDIIKSLDNYIDSTMLSYMYSLDHLVLSVPKIAAKLLSADQLKVYYQFIFELCLSLNKNYQILH